MKPKLETKAHFNQENHYCIFVQEQKYEIKIIQFFYLGSNGQILSDNWEVVYFNSANSHQMPTLYKVLFLIYFRRISDGSVFYA